MRAPRQDSVDRLLGEWRRERPDLDPSPIGIQGRIVRLSAHLLRRTDGWLAPLGLSWESFSVIVTLRRSGPPYELRPSDLLAESLLTSGAITNRLDRVERMGLVERRPDPRDRRGSIVRLTAEGKRLADRAIAQHIASVNAILETLAPKQRRQLASLLGTLLATLEQTAGTGRGSRPRRRMGAASD